MRSSTGNGLQAYYQRLFDAAQPKFNPDTGQPLKFDPQGGKLSPTRWQACPCVRPRFDTS